MDNIAGTPVEGDNFFGRGTEMLRLADILRNDDILLLGPRRIGKTSICRAVMGHVKASNWHAIEINVASCEDELAFLEKLHAALAPEMATLGSKIKDRFAATFDAISTRIKSIKIAVTGAGTASVDLAAPASEDWIHLGNDLLQLLMQAEAGQAWLVYIDELPIMLFNMIRNDTQNGVRRVRRFLDWFRNDVRALPGSRSVRWLVSGSVGLDTLVQQHGMADTINSLNHQNLAAFTEDVAIAMVLKLADRYQLALDNEAARKLVAAVQWAQPYYLQKAFHYLRQRVSANTNANTTTATDIISQIDPAMNDMVQPGSDNDFHHWEQRLALQLGAVQAAHAIALLNLAAHDAAGARPENMLAHLEGRMPNDSTEKQREMFINLRDILQRDAYWWPDESSGHKRYRFHLEPLRRWWLRRNTL